MSEQFLGEIRLFPYGTVPNGWAPCQGQILAISQNQALFSLLGTAYGGNGQTTFGLPDLRGRVPVHPGSGISPGTVGGEATHTLMTNEIPAHNHLVNASSANASVGNVAPTSTWANPGANAYNPSGKVLMDARALATSGNGQPHPNMQPYLALQFCIATSGIYPSRP